MAKNKEKLPAKSREQYIAENSEGNYNDDLITFSLLDASTVKRRQREGDVTSPYMKSEKYLDIPKDKRWNTKQLNSKLLQGILNGDPVDKIAKSFVDVIGNNKSASMRNARTMITGAECSGRMDSYEDLADKGVIQKKVWIATPDDRTRASHLEIDGEERDIDDEFSNGLMYPADPDGDASEVYNCRCSIRDRIVGFRRADGSIKYVTADRGETKHDIQIAEEKERREGEGEKPAETIKAVTTKQEAFESLQNTFTDVDDGLLKLNEELFVDSVNQFNKLNNKFNIVKENDGSYFSVNNSKHVAYSSTGYRDGQYEISLSNKYYKKMDVYQEMYENGQKTGFKMPSADEYKNVYTITHEYGHLLEGYVSRNRTDFDAIKEDIEKTWGHNPAVVSRYLSEAYTKSEKQMAKNIREEIIDIAKNNNPKFDIENNLSRYGHTDDLEFFAEAFANSQCGMPNELGNAMNQWLKKEGF